MGGGGGQGGAVGAEHAAHKWNLLYAAQKCSIHLPSKFVGGNFRCLLFTALVVFAICYLVYLFGASVSPSLSYARCSQMPPREYISKGLAPKKKKNRRKSNKSAWTETYNTLDVLIILYIFDGQWTKYHFYIFHHSFYFLFSNFFKGNFLN